MTPASGRIVTATCGHTLYGGEHRWVSADGRRIACSQRCLDLVEGRKPGNYRDEEG